MIDDRNKTELTRKATAAAYRFFDGAGFKPIETEVPICQGWIADLAGVIDPTETELLKLRMVPSKPRYRWSASNEWKEKYQSAFAEWKEQFDPMFRLLTAVIEVKTTRGDFRGDHKWSRCCPADLAYLVVPKDLISQDEYPPGWGIIEYNESSDSTKTVKRPTPRLATVEEQRDIVLSIAVRRDHQTRHERIREMNRRIRDERNEDQARMTPIKAMSAMMEIAMGMHGSVEECLERHQMKRFPGYMLGELKKLWNITPKADHP